MGIGISEFRNFLLFSYYQSLQIINHYKLSNNEPRINDVEINHEWAKPFLKWRRSPALVVNL